MRVSGAIAAAGLAMSVDGAALAETGPNNNVLAGFIAVKELSHCAAYYAEEIDRLPEYEREDAVWAAARLFASAIKVDEVWAETALSHARTHVSGLSDTGRESQYQRICALLYDSGNYRSRMLGWRYRLNAGEPVPQAFYDLRWEGPMPGEWNTLKRK